MTKILYAIQGTGNGHLSRARDIIPLLQQKAEVDVLISGTQADVSLPYPVKYQLEGLSFIFGKKGGVDLQKTFQKSRIWQLMQEVRSLSLKEYDLVINDFEPVSAWAALLQGKKCIGLSHQSAVASKQAPKPSSPDFIGKLVLKYYAPAFKQYGFHFQKYTEQIFTPVIRQQVRELYPEDHGHYTVYLPAYSDERIEKYLSTFPNTRWEVFSKHNTREYFMGNIHMMPIDNDRFVRSMASSTGVLCGAGFETPAEALYLGKKLLAIPMKKQYEQQCNAAALEDMGIPIVPSLKKKYLPKIENWLVQEQRVEVHYPNQTEFILDEILTQHLPESRQALTFPKGITGFITRKLAEMHLTVGRHQ
ncbi:glycosyltransferase family protein [Rapidithrix thailandica]|uniref:Glycosyltransferase family protein n=1 Tax=Rapidithrix thailandica TaxID=413964 RepID=A0AAW9S297_9BACT